MGETTASQYQTGHIRDIGRRSIDYRFINFLLEMISGSYKIGATIALGLALISVFGHAMSGKKFWVYGEVLGLAIGLILVIMYWKNMATACSCRTIEAKPAAAATTKEVKAPVVAKAGMMASIPNNGITTQKP